VVGLSGIFGTKYPSSSRPGYPVHHTVSGFSTPVANIIHRITLTVAYMQYDVLLADHSGGAVIFS